MKCKDCQYTTKKRRGLSTIVGGLIFVVLMVSAFSMLGLALQTQSDMGETARIVANANLQRQQEDFNINVYTDSNQLLTVDVKNIGQNHVEIHTLIITNSTDAANGFPTKVHDIPSGRSFVAPGYTGNVVLAFPITLALAANPGDTELYQFKVISSLGTIKTQSVSCDDTACGAIASAGGGLTATLFLDGPTGINTKTSTVILFVSNNGEVTLTNVRPLMGNPTTGSLCNDMWQPFPTAPAIQIDDVNPCQLDSPTPVVLIPGQSALFKWDGKIIGDFDDEVLFCNQARGVDPTFVDIDSAVVCDDLIVIDPNDCGSPACGPGDENPLDEKFITRPELFLTIPSPFGTFGDPPGVQPIARAIWGANVVNPTDTTMFIHKITMTAYAPTANSNIVIIKPGGFSDLDCNPQDISPGDGLIPGTQAQEAGFWSCPAENTIMWKNFAEPISLAPHSVFPFIVNLEASNVGNDNIESVLVDSTVFTTSGAFGKGNYQTTWYQNGMYANILLHEDIDSVDLTKVHTQRSGIMSDSVETFRINLAEMDYDDSTYINANSKIIVNVPRAFTEVKVVNAETTGILIGAPNIEPSVVVHADDTTQIIATITDHIGDEFNPEVITLTFTARAPTVATPKLMVMYTLAVGEGTGGSSVGPLTEIILQVLP